MLLLRLWFGKTHLIKGKAMKPKDRKTMLISVGATFMVLLFVCIAQYDDSPCAYSKFMAESPIKGLRFGMSRKEVLDTLEEANVRYGLQYDEGGYILSIRGGSLKDRFGDVGNLALAFKYERLEFFIMQHNFKNMYDSNSMLENMRVSLDDRYGSFYTTIHESNLNDSWRWEDRDNSYMQLMSISSKNDYATAIGLGCRE